MGCGDGLGARGMCFTWYIMCGMGVYGAWGVGVCGIIVCGIWGMWD